MNLIIKGHAVQNPPKIALVLTGGGARGAYQAGFLKGISEIIPVSTLPFSIVTGCSVGAINAAFLISRAQNFQEATQKLWTMWANIQPEGIFIPKRGAFLKIGLNWLGHLAFKQKSPLITTLMDNMPLKNLLQDQLDFDAIAENIRNKNIYAAAFTAMDYGRRISTTFFDSAHEMDDWDKKSSLGRRTKLTVDHVASSAGLPLLFEPVKIDDSYFGDGSIKNLSPLRPAVRLGADKILVITTYELKKSRSGEPNLNRSPDPCPSFGSILGMMFQSVFSDAIDSDLDRLNELNHFAGNQVKGKILKHINSIDFRPTKDLGRLVTGLDSKISPSFRKFLNLIGGLESEDQTFVSYMMFDQSYTTRLLEAGYQDALNQQSQLMTFFASKK